MVDTLARFKFIVGIETLAELKARYERLSLLYQVSNRIHSSLDPREALRLILSEAVRLMNASSGSIVLVNPTNGFLEIEASHGLPAQCESLKLRLGEGITGWVARHGKTARVGNVLEDPRYIMVKENVRSELAVPLVVMGEIRGVINVDSDRLQAFGLVEEELLEELSMQAAKVVHNTWLYEQLRLKARLFESLVSVGQTINSTLSLDEALQVITREACVLMEGKMCSLLLLDETREWLDLRASYGAGEVYTTKPRLNVAESFLGVVIRRGKPLQLENVQTSSRYQNAQIARAEGLISLLSVPLIYRREVIGALNIYTGEPHSFSNEEIRILAALAELSGIAIQKARLYERLVTIEDQLRRNEKLSAIGLLAAEVAHEIRNPLTVMKMLFHSLDLQFPETDARRRDVEVIAAKMDHLNKIVEQILDFSKTAAPNLAPVNINDLVDDLMLLVRHKLQAHQITLSANLRPDLPAVTADAAQIGQVFLNLTLNALEAMPQGGKLAISTQVVKTRQPEPGDWVQIEFQDTGHGMTEEQQNRAFTLFQTTKKKGAGLGLAIVGRIIEEHHGSIQVRSRVGGGTRIRVRLPCGGGGA